MLCIVQIFGCGNAQNRAHEDQASYSLVSDERGCYSLESLINFVHYSQKRSLVTPISSIHIAKGTMIDTSLLRRWTCNFQGELSPSLTGLNKIRSLRESGTLDASSSIYLVSKFSESDGIITVKVSDMSRNWTSDIILSPRLNNVMSFSLRNYNE